ncbi:hypothetical protein [Catelliglobosispora koreensis]|uniref:hypothetical protein n=1 Tax=Catelliglobosispora koreensis TaxID=129052 RepID=UPI00036B5FFA|nr:hypothetical protein [Catelliglobosispora koreensis]
MSAAEPRDWGIRSLATGRAYLWAKSQRAAEFMQAGTGRPDGYEIVQFVDGELIVRDTRPNAPPMPEFARQPLAEPMSEDDEVLRMLFGYTDPAYGIKIPPLTMTAAEIRERAEAQLRANPMRWHWHRLRVWWYHRRH